MNPPTLSSILPITAMDWCEMEDAVRRAELARIDAEVAFEKVEAPFWSRFVSDDEETAS